MNKIKQLREEKGMTQADLAKAVYTTQAAVAHWEAGRYQPNLSSMIHLARVFNIPLEELVKEVS